MFDTEIEGFRSMALPLSRLRRIVCLLAPLLIVPAARASRSLIADWAIDLTPHIESAPLVFRGRVVSVSKTSSGFPADAIAQFQVDRWYRGSGRSKMVLHFKIGIDYGQGCNRFAKDTYWMVFAEEKNGRLEPFDSCNGIAAISRLLGPTLESFNPLDQIEGDVIAGLQDSSEAGRILSVQRLGGLKLASSRPALQRIIDGPKPLEAKWATYAALRTGDLSVLARVVEILKDEKVSDPDLAIAFEFGSFKDRRAIPILIDIANRSRLAVARLQAVRALGNNFGSDGLRCIADHLEDSDRGVRSHALLMMEKITHEPACTSRLEPRDAVEMQDRQIQSCLAWWKQQP